MRYNVSNGRKKFKWNTNWSMNIRMSLCFLIPHSKWGNDKCVAHHDPLSAHFVVIQTQLSFLFVYIFLYLIFVSMHFIPSEALLRIGLDFSAFDLEAQKKPYLKYVQLTN